MSRRRRDRVVPPTAVQQLDALYAELPQIECRGACWDSCTSIRMTGVEQRRIAATGTVVPNDRPDTQGRVCPALTMLHQCGVYEVRPLICRLWGLTELMPCTYGCRPADGRLLTERESHEFIARAQEIAGEHAEAEKTRAPWRIAPERAEEVMREYNRRLADEALAEDVRRRALIASGKPVLYVRGRGHVSSQPPASGANS